MSEISRKDVPFWNVNVPREEWTEECPDYLADVDQNDRKHLSLWDEDYHVQSWAEVQDVIRKTTSATILCTRSLMLGMQVTTGLSSLKDCPRSCMRTESIWDNSR